MPIVSPYFERFEEVYHATKDFDRMQKEARIEHGTYLSTIRGQLHILFCTTFKFAHISQNCIQYMKDFFNMHANPVNLGGFVC